MFLFRGKEYDSFKSCCEEYGLKSNNLNAYSRKNNVSKVDTLEHYLSLDKIGYDFVFRNKEYKSFNECCEEYRLASSMVSAYARNHNTSKAEALEYYLSPERVSTEFVFRDKTYKSFRACCKEYGVSCDSVGEYLKRYSISKQEALEHYLNPNRKTNKFVFDGIEYSSFKACCREYGISYGAVRSFIRSNNKKGYNITREDAVKYYIGLKNTEGVKYNRVLSHSRDFEFRGITYSSFTECCRRFGINSDNVIHYVRRNKDMAKQEGLENYLAGKVSPAIFEFRGKQYKSFTDCCKEYNLNYDSLLVYSRENNISKQETIEFYLNKEYFVFRDKKYNSFKECCNEFNICCNTVIGYLQRNKNATKQEALEYYLNPNRDLYPFSFRNEKFKSLNACCDKYNVNSNTIKWYMNKHGVTEQEALEYYLDENRVTSFTFYFRDNKYKSFVQCCKSFGLNYTTLLEHIKSKGVSKQEALEYYLSIKETRDNIVKIK